jgi:hypothetical protein
MKLSQFSVVIVLLISSSLIHATSGKHLFILSGQSNMEGMHHWKDFTPQIKQAFGADNIIVVWDAKGGEPISRWYKSWKSSRGDIPKLRGDLYDRLMQKVITQTSGQKLSSVSFLWMQGETDARNGDGDVYRESLTGLVRQLSEDLRRDDINVIIGRISDYDMQNREFPHWTLVRNEQIKFSENYPRSSWFDTDDLNDGLDRLGKQVTNDLHYSKIGYEILGKRFADHAIQLIKKWSDTGNSRSD